MSTPYTRAPHQEGPQKTPGHSAPNAALLIDFDNVTMGMRSDLSNELKNLLNSDIIKGKVAVQRAYADWRRYPQYIVPLSEASIDLIFAPAYGSNKKNATDIRMAIDALELIFIRPEIGTFILLTGDSDFSSLVLKLKEYGKYVIGVGIQESSSDILVQNCDEYYSYTSLAGLRKTTEADTEPVDPWILVENAVKRMEDRNDVMRSDRLKQVMLEIDAGFDESEYGFSKFSRFLTEASSRGLVDLRKLDNGQYEVHSTGKSSSREPAASGSGGSRSSAEGRSRSGSGGGGGGSSSSGRASRRTRGRSTRSRKPSEEQASKPERSAEPDAAPASGGDPLEEAYDLMRRALKALTDERNVSAVRDSDVKRRMLSFEAGFDEAELGFSKFSRFLEQADEHDVVKLRKRDSGNFEVALPGAATEPSGSGPTPDAETTAPRPRELEPETGAGEPDEADEAEERDEEPAAAGAGEPTPRGRGLGPRGGEKRGRRKKDGPPPLLEGQVVGAASSGGGAASGSDRPSTEEGPSSTPERREEPETTPAPSGDGGGSVVDPDDLGLPTDRTAIVRYMANSYKGVGEKTAEAVVDALGDDVFGALQSHPEKVRDAIPSNRADQLLDAWETDLRRRRERLEEAGVEVDASENGGAAESDGSGEDGGSSGGATAGAPSRDSEPEEEATPVGAGAEGSPDGGESDDSEDEPPRTRLGRRRRTRG